MARILAWQRRISPGPRESSAVDRPRDLHLRLQPRLTKLQTDRVEEQEPLSPSSYPVVDHQLERVLTTPGMSSAQGSDLESDFACSNTLGLIAVAIAVVVDVLRRVVAPLGVHPEEPLLVQAEIASPALRIQWSGRSARKYLR